MTCELCGAVREPGERCPGCGTADRFYRAVTPSGAPSSAPAAGSPSRPSLPSLAGGTPPGEELGFVSDRFHVLRTLGMGGVGMVYLAREKATDQLYALKVLRPSLRANQEVIARFKREVEVAGRIDHPNVAKVYSFNEADGHRFIVMQYIAGMDLGEYVRRTSPTLEQKLAIIRAVAAGVDAAHRAGVVHRDLKPGNIRIAKDGTPYVLDFGVAATDEGGEITRIGSFIGTPLYMSPEQAQGKRVDHRSDIYSLGAVLYELVVGRPPFIGESAITIALKHVRERPLKPRSLNPAVPPPIEAAVLHCLEKDPSARPASASDIVRRIDAAMAAEVQQGRSAAKAAAHEPNSGELADVSLFQYLRLITPIRRTFLLEIVNHQEFGRYHFKGAHLVHAEAGNLRDEEVAYNLFYWTRGIFRVVTDPEPPGRESVSIPWIPFVEKYFERVRGLLLPLHTLFEGPIVLDLLDPKGASVFRYAPDPAFEKAVGERATLGLEAFQKARAHLKSHDVTKMTRAGSAHGQLFCLAPGLRHYVYAVTGPKLDVEALHRWIRNDLEQAMIAALHDCLQATDRKKGGRAISAKIVLAEHEDFLGNLTRIKFRSLGMDVYLVRDGSKLLEVAPQFRPDVLVLDVQLPGIGGFDLCRAFALDPRLAETPIVLLAPAGQGEQVRALDLPGVVRVVEKPLLLDELVDVVRRYAARSPVSRRAAGVAEAKAAT